MALDPKYLQSLPNSLIDMYGLVEIDILSDMARRIATYDYFIPSAQFQMQKLEELGAERTFIIESLSAMTGKAQSEIVELLTEAGEVAIADDVEYYKAAQVYEPNKIDKEALYKNLNNGLIHTQQAFKNITQTTANTATKQFENALDRAWTQINVGGMDYTTAIKEAIKDLSEAGVGSVEYKSGRVDNIEVAVRRAIVTGANQTAIKTQETLADELGVDLVEVTAHGGARPSHAKWQGQCFSRNGRKVIEGVVYEDLKKATGYGSAGGLCGVNCRHSFHPYVHGTARTWNEKQLAKLEEKNIEYNGEKYTEYEASQIQRGIEREIRKRKRMVAALEAAGQDAGEERKKLRDAQKVYTDFTKQTGIRKQSARTQIGSGGTATPATTQAPIMTKDEQDKYIKKFLADKNQTQTTERIVISGADITIKKITFGFSDGNGGAKKTVDAVSYETTDGTQFIFPKKYNKKQQTMTPEQALTAWQKVPQSIRKQAQKIVEFVDYYNPMDSYWRKVYRNFPQSYATGGNEITFYRWDYPHDDDYVVRTYCHEAGHYIDKSLATTAGRFSAENLWTKAMSDDIIISSKKSCTSYGENSPTEDFAESMAEYIKDKTAFEKDFPNRAAILSQII